VSCASPGGTAPSALASWATTGRSPTAATRSAALVHVPERTSRAPRAWTANRHCSSTAKSAPSAAIGERIATAPRRSVTAKRRRALQHGRGADRLARGSCRCGRGGLRGAEGLSSLRSGSRSSKLPKGVAELGAVRRLCDELGDVQLEWVSRLRSPAALNAGASACVVRFSLRFAQRSRRCSQHVLKRAKRCRSSEAVLSPIPSTPGMLSRCRP